MSKDFRFVSPNSDQAGFDPDYDYKVMLNDDVPLHVCAPGEVIEIKRVKRPKPLTPDMLIEGVVEQLLRDGEIKDSDELARTILDWHRARNDKATSIQTAN